MKRVRTLTALLAAVLLATTAWPSGIARLSAMSVSAAQDSTSALERGWRTGYSDGYRAGFADKADRAPRDFKNNEDYLRADRAYLAVYGPLEDYRDGYQQGFEAGYNSGYDKRDFDSTIPAGLRRRGTTTATVNTQAGNANSRDDTDDTSSSSSGNISVNNSTRTSGIVLIPRDTVMRVELLTNLSTEASQEGDRFQARVIEPAEYEGAVVDGRVRRVKRPGRVKGAAELQLSFEQIRLPDNRFTNLNAQVIEVVDTPGTGRGTGEVDEEGGVKGKDSTKRDAVKIGTSSAIGAIIGAIAGGGKGAAIGAAIGGAIGTGGVLSQKGSDIYLLRGQHLRIRTNSDTRF